MQERGGRFSFEVIETDEYVSMAMLTGKRTEPEPELPIFAMLRLYLNGCEDCQADIDAALIDSEGVVNILEKAAAYSITKTADFAGDRRPVNDFFDNLDCREVAELSGERIITFLGDFRNNEL